MVGSDLFHLPHNLFSSTLLYSIQFSLPITVCFKSGIFSLCFSREPNGEIWSRMFLFPIYLCGTQNEQHNQAGVNYFQHFIWISWVCQLSPTYVCIDCSQVFICSLSAAIGLPDLGASSSGKLPTWNFTNHIWHICSVTAPPPYTAQFFFFFAFQLHSYLSWNNKAQYARILLFSFHHQY